MFEHDRSLLKVGNCGAYMVAALLFALMASGASAESRIAFEERCLRMSATATVSVVFEDKAVTRINNRGIAELKALSGTRSSQYHSTLGLTHAVPSANLKVTPNILVNGNGMVCVLPSVVLTLGFSEFDVYVAKELKDSCRRGIVEAHENEHAAVWRNHWRAGARLLETTLRRSLAQPGYAANQEQAINEMNRRVNAVIAPLLLQLKDGVIAANQQIDSPASYQFEANRMGACP